MIEFVYGVCNFFLDEILCYGVLCNIVLYLNVVKFIEVVCFFGKFCWKFFKVYNMCGVNVLFVF